jgi:hypothetical protein
MGFWGTHRGKGHLRRHRSIERKKFHYARRLAHFVKYGAQAAQAVLWRLVRIGRADAPNDRGWKTGITDSITDTD